MINPKNFIFLALFFSFILHILVICLCSLHIEARANPVIYNWFNIVSKKDLSLEKKDIIFPLGLDFSSDSIRQKYFFSFPSNQRFLKTAKCPSLNFPPYKENFCLKELSTYTRKSSYFYLWERVFIFSSLEEKPVSYKAYVSSRGKVLLLYPENLPFDSNRGLYSQEYIREAALFLDNSFFWTRLKEVIK
ncbi:MAG: hypothetical protein ABIH08_06635 [Candidatus Omnitrophota bacterium]